MPFPQQESAWTIKQDDDVPPYASPPPYGSGYRSQSPADVRRPEEPQQHASSTPLQHASYPPPSTASNHPSYPTPPSSWYPWEQAPYPSAHQFFMPHQHHPRPPYHMEAYRYPGVYPCPHPHPMYSPPQPLPIITLQEPYSHPHHSYYFEQTPSQQRLYTPHQQQTEQPHSEQAAPPSPHHPPSLVYLSSNPQHQNDLLVYLIREEDVLCGRGAPNHLHPGYVMLCELINCRGGSTMLFHGYTSTSQY
jgi:hypothetical protein